MIAHLNTRQRRLRRAALVPAATFGLLISGCGSLAAHVSDRASGAARKPAATGTAVLGTGHIGSRAQVPWSKVGLGWELIQYSRTTAVPPVKPGTTTLDLVDPHGRLYQLFSWPAKAVAPNLIAWSGDRSRALLGISSGKVEQLTLATGTTSTFMLPGNASVLGYTKPEGTSVLAGRNLASYGGTGSFGSIGRYTQQGKLELRLTAGRNLGGVVVESEDGTDLVVGTGTGMELVSNSGQVIRSLPVRGSGGCNPVRYWSAATILASCGASQGRHQLWLVPVSGARPAALTPVRNGHGPDLGDVGAWQLGGGLYLQALGACGDQFIARQHADGSVSAIGVPGAPANDNRIITAAGGRLLVLALTGCESSNSLLWFNPGTRAEQWLVKAPHAVQGVVSVVPYFSTQNQNSLY
jgi:TolB protein